MTLLLYFAYNTYVNVICYILSIQVQSLLNIIELYINAVITAVQDLADVDKIIESIAAILLRGLTPRFDPLTMVLKNSVVQILSELIKSKP